MKKKWHGYVLIAPLMAGYLLFYIIPFGVVLWNSLVKKTESKIVFAGLENYRVTWNNPGFRTAFLNTLRFLAVGLPLILLCAYLIALLLKHRAGSSRLLRSVFLSPYIMPVAGCVLLVDLLFSETGLLNGLLELLGLPAESWLQGPFAFWAVVLLYLWKNTGYSAVLLLAGLVTISDEQYEAAALDGAGALQKFLFITTPQMWYSLFFTLVFSVINAFKSFREIFLVGGLHPNENMYMLQHFINNSFISLNVTQLSVSSVLLLTVILVFFLGFYTFVRKKEI